jgi:DNA replication protein DnaC
MNSRSDCKKCGGIGFVWQANECLICDCGIVTDRARLHMHIPIEYRSASLDNAPHALKTQYAACRAFGKQYSRRTFCNRGLILVGEGRSGKSYAACAVANFIFDRAVKSGVVHLRDIARFYSIAHLAGELRQAAADGWLEDLRNEVNRPEILILDDLSTPDFTPFLLSQLYLIAEHRVQTGKGLIITVDADPANISDGAQWVRIYNRLIEIVADGRPLKSVREIVAFPKIRIKEHIKTH